MGNKFKEKDGIEEGGLLTIVHLVFGNTKRNPYIAIAKKRFRAIAIIGEALRIEECILAVRDMPEP